MWLKYPETYRHRVRLSSTTLYEELEKQVNFLGDRLSLSGTRLSSASPFRTGTATRLPYADNVFNGAVTSPPYATRIDYVRGTLPELAVLRADQPYVKRLRSAITGSLLVKESSPSLQCDLASPYAINVLRAIRSHVSKGSRSYYFPWMSNYVYSLQAGLLEINRTVKPNCPICIVVQDSYYKEIPVGMQQIVIEMLSAVGRRIEDRYDYSAPNPRAQSVRRSGAGRCALTNSETLLVFS